MSSRDPSLLSSVAVVDIAALTAGGEAGQHFTAAGCSVRPEWLSVGARCRCDLERLVDGTRFGVADGLSAADLAAVRFGIAGLVLLPLAWRFRQAVTRVAPWLLLFMALGAGAPYALVAGTGVTLSSAGVGGAITVGLLPVFTLVLSMLVLRERATKRMAAGIGCILVGAACVAAGAWNADGNRLGLLFFVAGALMWAGYTVSMRRAGLLPQTAASVVCVASLMFYVPVWAFTGGPERLAGSCSWRPAVPGALPIAAFRDRCALLLRPGGRASRRDPCLCLCRDSSGVLDGDCRSAARRVSEHHRDCRSGAAFDWSGRCYAQPAIQRLTC